MKKIIKKEVFEDPDTLNLSKDQVLKKFEKIEEDIFKSDEGIKSKVKFKLVFGVVNWLIKNYDIEVLNRIFLAMIREFDDMRFTNALEGDQLDLTNLKKVKEAKEE